MNISYLLIFCLAFSALLPLKAQIEPVLDAVDLEDMFVYKPSPVQYKKIYQPLSPLPDEAMDKLPAFGKLLYTDEKPLYQEWNKGYIVDKIEYFDTRTVVHFRFSTPDLLSIVYFHKNGYKPWFLRDVKTKDEFPLLEVRNVRLNKVLYADIMKNDVHFFNYEENSKQESTCEVHFAALPKSVKKVHLIEGHKRENWTNHFNAFNIVIKRSDNEIVKVKDEKLPEINESKKDLYKVYPNPTKGMISIQALEEEAEGKVTLQLYDLGGKLIFTQPNLMVTKGEAQSIELPAQLSDGQYVLRILGNGITTVQLVLAK
jgi:hypothetical protein